MKCLYTNQMLQALQASMEMGIPNAVLMENAGGEIFRKIQMIWPRSDTERVIIVAGKGANGGCGFVTARHLWNAGYDVRVYVLARPSEFTGDIRMNLNIIINMGLPISVILDSSDIEQFRTELFSKNVDLCIDAIFGTGLSREVLGLPREVIECMNDSTVPVLAIDVPSGLDADTGLPLGIAVRATRTISFAYPKVGLVLASATQYVGTLEVVDISIPKNVEDISWKVSLLDNTILGNIPVRPPEAHKGNFGRVAVFAGSQGLTGVAYLICNATLRSGCGQVTLAIPHGLNHIMEVKITEAVTCPMGTPDSLHFQPDMIDRALELARCSDAIAIGPGIGFSTDTKEFVRGLMDGSTPPAVFDADALHVLAKTDFHFTTPAVITPHPGQMSQLLGLDIKSIQTDPIKAAMECADRYNAVSVLKGHRSIIASPSGDVAINPTGSNAMASAGMGALLPGIIATFLAQGLPQFDAACLGVYLHGLASDRVSQTISRGQLATDLLIEIPALLKEYSDYRIYQ
jgi:hydroxyethylthiazole kinase-like uncharacterized protein yjeF